VARRSFRDKPTRGPCNMRNSGAMFTAQRAAR
jgi:hypothetical protein